jgi:hypothetical protein
MDTFVTSAGPSNPWLCFARGVPGFYIDPEAPSWVPLRAQRVGWVERSETHQFPARKMMGFARALPILRATGWAVWGSIATIVPLANLYFMVFKP